MKTLYIALYFDADKVYIVSFCSEGSEVSREVEENQPIATEDSEVRREAEENQPIAAKASREVEENQLFGAEESEVNNVEESSLEENQPIAAEDLEYQEMVYGNYVSIKDTYHIGSGRFGNVWKGKLVDSGKPSAVKIMNGQYPFYQLQGKVDITLCRKFKTECKFLKSLSHPNIVLYLRMVTDHKSKAPVLVMELMDENLTTYLASIQESLPLASQVKICCDISSALTYLHSLEPRVVHRDLSSNNILVNEECAKVSDFGISRLIDRDREDKSLSNTGCGTRGYEPPESWTAKVYDEKWDIFQLGVLMVQIATCKHPAPTLRVDDSFKVVLEIDRRADHLKLIQSSVLQDHACACLHNDPKQRPPASKIQLQLKRKFQHCIHNSLRNTWCCYTCNLYLKNAPDFVEANNRVFCNHDCM